jgi:Immunity protein 35
MDKVHAQTIAERYLSGLEKASDLELAFNPGVVEEHDVGFVFFYNTKAYWETRDFMHALAGNGPLLVRRDTGEVVELPSNQSVERSLADLASC